ncbi:MAG: 7-cyano-7-deazaguanine synthase [Candidatus Aenigmatarchaeota archaeon]
MKKIVSLISGGIDSPVAAYMVGRFGDEIVPIYFDNYPFSSENNKMKAKEAVERLKKHVKIDELMVIPHGEYLLEVANKCKRKYTCVLCRRQMFRVAEKVCKKIGGEGIITGEFLGSKASQTLKNMEVISQAVSIPIIRPLLGLDKEEIQEIGRKIGTFGEGISHAGCCAMVPKRPCTKADLEKILEEEKKVEKVFFN